MPKAGNSKIGRSEVTGIGTASVDHHIKIQVSAATSFQDKSLKAEGVGKLKSIIKNKGPKKTKKYLLINSFSI